ncbi:hypothetical protein N7493_011846 [Penicillium malachiteum]|uniref:Uncharacterized protein n=1 Tax=Penicillium malachiteum TaxID=1324776 RepID=A0AAD6HAJ5_9EURO|nr:hypothetical protein N7493_011846 [Penicillium malachiteum]
MRATIWTTPTPGIMDVVTTLTSLVLVTTAVVPIRTPEHPAGWKVSFPLVLEIAHILILSTIGPGGGNEYSMNQPGMGNDKYGSSGQGMGMGGQREPQVANKMNCQHIQSRS